MTHPDAPHDAHPTPQLNAALAPLAQALADAQTASLHQPQAPTLARAAWHGRLPTRDTAYALQQDIARRQGWWTDTSVPQYWKSGGPGRALPLSHAALDPAGVVQAEGSSLDLRGRPPRGPLAEAEIALRLGHAVTPDRAARLGAAEAGDLVDAWCLSVELVGSRWDAPATPPAPDDEWLGLADGLGHCGLVLGPWLAPRPLDWAQQRCRLSVTGGEDAPRIVDRIGSHPLGDPFWGLTAWLRHLTRDGQTVPAGTVVSTGSWTGVTPVRAGERLTLAFGGLGQLELQF